MRTTIELKRYGKLWYDVTNQLLTEVCDTGLREFFKFPQNADRVWLNIDTDNAHVWGKWSAYYYCAIWPVTLNSKTAPAVLYKNKNCDMVVFDDHLSLVKLITKVAGDQHYLYISLDYKETE